MYFPPLLIVTAEPSIETAELSLVLHPESLRFIVIPSAAASVAARVVALAAAVVFFFGAAVVVLFLVAVAALFVLAVAFVVIWVLEDVFGVLFVCSEFFLV